MLIYLQMVETKEERDLIENYYMEYRNKMMRVAYSILHNQQDAEEVVHQAFLRLCNNTSLLPKEVCHKTEGFFVVIVRNIAIDLYRRKKKIKEIEYNEEFVGVSVNDPVEEVVFSKESSEKLAAIIAEMSPHNSETLILKYYYGYKNNECAKLLGISPETFRQHLCRAKKKLEHKCKEEGIII